MPADRTVARHEADVSVRNPQVIVWSRVTRHCTMAALAQCELGRSKPISQTKHIMASMPGFLDNARARLR